MKRKRCERNKGYRNGVLNIDLINGFESSVAAGDSFEILTFTQRNGDFSAINVLDDLDGLSFEPSFDANRLILTAINSVNTAPIALDDGVATAADSPLAIPVADLLDNDSDADGNSLSISHIDRSNTQGTVSLDSGVVTYDPNGTFDGLGVGEEESDRFQYIINDGNGGASQAEVTVTVQGVNDAPEAGDDGFTINEGETLTLTAQDLLQNDTDIDITDTLAIAEITGNADVSWDGTTLTYDPGTRFDRLTDGDQVVEAFDYTLSDGNGGTDTGTVTITINGQTDADDFIDLSTWQQQGEPDAGDWQTTGDFNHQVTQLVNGNPTFLVSPFDFIDGTVTGTFKVETTTDDDFIGFVFGYQGPVAAQGDAPSDYEFLLFDWRQTTQTSDAGEFGPEGFTLSRVSASHADPNTPLRLWDHNGTEVLATEYDAGRGWQ